MKGAHVNLHIEELVLHGFAPGDRYAIAEAVERELSHLLATRSGEQGIPSSLSHNADYPSLDAGVFQVTSTARPNVVGAQIAQAVHGGLTK